MLKFKVIGMTCGHCARTVSRAVEEVPLVDGVQVDLAQNEVRVSGTADEAALRNAIEAAGYRVLQTA